MQCSHSLCLAAAFFLSWIQPSESAAASFTKVADFSYNARGAVFDAARNRLYLSQTESNRVWSVNPATGVVERSFAFDFHPGLVTLSPDGKNLVVHFPSDSNEGQAYVQTLSLDSGGMINFFSVGSENISDLLALEEGLLVLLSQDGVGQSYRSGSGTILDSWGFGSNGRLVKALSPSDFYSIGYSSIGHFSANLLTGQITFRANRSCYAASKTFLHPSGTNLITQSGEMFSVSSDPSKDLLSIGSLPFRVEAAAFDTNENAFFAATTTNVIYYNATTFESIRNFQVTNTPDLLLLSGNSLVCVSMQSSATRLFVMPNPAAGSAINTPPTPAFTWDPVPLDTISRVNFDASASKDGEDALQELMFRWDWQNDGQFDTDWSSSPLASHLFSMPGQKSILLEVQDSRGMKARATNTFSIILGNDFGIAGRTNIPFQVPFAASEVALGLQQTNAFLADPVGKRIVELNLVTGRIAREFPCFMAPVQLCLTPDGRFLYAGLTPEWPRVYQRPYNRGLVDEFDLAAGVRTRELEIGADPFDMLATADTLIVSPANQFQESSAFWLGTGQARTNFSVGSKARIALHPSGTAYYAAATDSVPYDIYRVNFGPGGYISSYGSPYHGHHPVEAGVWVHPQGKLVITRGGGIFTSSDTRENDMIFVQTLEGGLAEDMFFDQTRKALFTVAAAKLRYYHSETFTLAREYSIGTGGRFVLANSNTVFAFSVSSNSTSVLPIPNPAVGGESNQPPQVGFAWHSETGMPVFIRFDASSTTDDTDQTAALLYRWDFDDDGVFDTTFTNSPVASWQYPLAGSKLVTLQVKDRYAALSANRQLIHIPTPIAEPDPETLEPVFEAPIAASAVSFDPVRPYLYATSDKTRRLLKINLITGLVEGEVTFALKPTAIAVNPQGSHLYVALLERDYSAEVPTSLIAEFDLSAGFDYRTFSVPMDVYKIAATDRRIVIATGYSRSILSLASFNSATGLLLSQADTSSSSELALPRAQNTVFISERNVSPPSIYQIAFNPLTGKFGAGTPIGASGGAIFPDSGGQWVVNAFGKVHSTNAVLLRRLENGTISDAWFDPARPALFTAAGGQVSFYNSTNFELAATYPALAGTTYIGGWSNSIFAASLETNRLVLQRILSPAWGAETNAPPQPAFTATPTQFLTFQNATFDAAASRDDSTPADQLLYRWDWLSDGTFDTPFTNYPGGTHRYNISGQIRVTLQVKDRFGAVATLVKTNQVVAIPDLGVTSSNRLATATGLNIGASAFDPVRPHLYILDTVSNRVLRVRFDTNAAPGSLSAPLVSSAVIDRWFQLDYTPGFITIAPSGARMYVAEVPTNTGPANVNVFDLETSARVFQFQIPETPYDMLATDAFLISSARSSSGVRSFRIADGKEVCWLRSYGSGNTRLALHPSQNFFYGSSAWTSSGDVHHFDLNPSTGVITDSMSRSGIDHWTSPLIVINPYGTNLVTRRGYICTSSDTPANDLIIQRTLSPTYFQSAVFAPRNYALFTSLGSALNLYDLRDFQLKRSFGFPSSIRQLSVYGGQLFSLCGTETNAFLTASKLPSAGAGSNLAPSYARVSNLTNGTVIPLPGVLQLEAQADDPDGWITRVEYYLGFAYLGASTNSSFRFAWTNPPPGTYSVTAIAHDNWGGTVSSEPVDVTLNYRPNIEILSPSSGATFAAPSAVQITTSALDSDGSVQEVRYYLNSILVGIAASQPFALTLENPPLGTNLLEAIAIDNLGTESMRATTRFTMLPAVPNDPFAGSLPLIGSDVTVTASNVRATIEKDEPLHSSVTGGHSLWYTWTAPSAGVVTMDTAGSEFDTLLAVYTGSVVTNLTEIASNDDYPGLGSLSQVKFRCVAGRLYRIAVDGSRGATGTLRLNLAVTPDAPAPTVGNDMFANRFPLLWTSNRISVTASNQLATRELTEPNHAGLTGGKSLWWTWVAPTNGSVRASTAGSDFDTLLAVYDGNWFYYAPVASNDDDPAAGLTSSVHFNVFAGVTYNIVVDGFNGDSGRIVLDLAYSATPVGLLTNDYFAESTRLTNASFVQVASSTLATREALEPLHAGNAGGKSLWWSWTPELSGAAIISTKGSRLDTLLGVYTGSELATLSPLTSNDDPGSGTTQAEARFNAIAGTRYHIAVDGFDGANGLVMLSAAIDQAGPAPLNDNFSYASSLSGTNIEIETTNIGATREKSEPLISSTEGGKSLWWTWTAPADGALVLSTAGSGFDTLLGLFSGTTLVTLYSIASNDDFLPETGSRIKTTVTAGMTYQIAVDGYRGAVGNVRLSLQFMPFATTPPNNMFANRTVLSGMSNNVMSSTMKASRESYEPYHAGKSGGHSLWWEWTAPSNGTATVSTEGSDFDTVLAVYTGYSLFTLTPVASNDDAAARGDFTSRLTFTAVAGTSYQIAADGYAGAAGNLRLNLFASSADSTKPINDDFAHRTILFGSSIAAQGQNSGATSEPGEPSLPGSVANRTVWWTWTAPASGTVEVSAKGSTFDTLLAVYSGGSLTDLTRIAENDDDPFGGTTSRLQFEAIRGRTYEIQVDGYQGRSGDVALTLSATPPLLMVSPKLLPDSYSFQVDGPLGQLGIIETSTNLSSWIPVATNRIPFEYTSPRSAADRVRFFRVK